MVQKKLTILLFMLAVFKMSAQNKIIIEVNTSTQSTEKYKQNETEIESTLYTKLSNKNTITNTTSYKYTGLNYSLNNLELSNSPIQFNRIENDLLFTQLLTSKTSVNVSVNPVATFEKNLGVSDIALLGKIDIGYQFNKNTSINVGAQRGTTFGEIQILPTLSFRYKVNEVLKLDLGFPYATVSYSNNVRNEFKLTNNFVGTYYNLDNKTINNAATVARFSSMTTSFEYERNVDSNWFLNFKGGYEFDKKFSFEDNNQNTAYDFQNNNAYLFTIGLKYKY